MKNKKDHLPYILILGLILAGIYWYWWIPGSRVALDFPLISGSSLKSFMDIPRMWFETGGEGLGGYAIFTLWSWPASFMVGFLTNLGLSFELIERLFFIIPFLFLGSFSIWKYGGYLNLSSAAKFISTLFYLSNTYILLIIDGGQLLISLSYAWFPFSFFLIEKSIRGNFKKKILAGLSITTLGFLDIRFIYILFLLSTTRFLFGFYMLKTKEWLGWVKDWVKLGIISGFIFLGLNSYWILAQLFLPLENEIFTRLTQTSFTNFSNIANSILLLSPHWFKNVFGLISPIRFEFILIPILVFISPILKPRNSVVGFWLLVALIGIFLSKGSAEPLSGVYQWFFYNIPGFSLFRDSTKFFFLVSLSFAILLGVTTDWFFKKADRLIKLRFLFLASVTVYLVFLSAPAWQGLMTGILSKPSYQKEYREIENFLKNDQAFARVFWIPSTRPLTYSDLNHPIIEASRLVEKRPFAAGVLGTYEIFNFLREAPYMGELFDIAGIGYIIYPYLDPRRDNLHPDNIKYYYTFVDQLSNLPWASKIDNLSMPVLKVSKHQDRFFITPNAWWVIGSDEIYNEATKSAILTLSKNSLIFAEETVGLGSRIDQLPFAKIVLYKKEPLDLVASFIDPNDLIFPARGLDVKPGSNGWWKRDGSDIINWRYFLKTKYGIDNKDFDLGGGWAVAEGNLELDVKDERIAKEKVLLVRAMESSRSGVLSFYQGSKLVGKVNTQSQDTNIKWFKVGKLDTSDKLTIKTEGDINVVNVIALLKINKLKEYEERISGYQSRMKDFSDQDFEQENISVTYTKVNIAEYKVRIEGLKEPKILIFSESFNKGWKLNNKQPFPIYSLVNGFVVDEDGEYEVSFESQKYIIPGLLVSGASLILILLIIFIPRRFR